MPTINLVFFNEDYNLQFAVFLLPWNEAVLKNTPDLFVLWSQTVTLINMIFLYWR